MKIELNKTKVDNKSELIVWKCDKCKNKMHKAVYNFFDNLTVSVNE